MNELAQFRILSRDSIRKLLNSAVLTRDGDPIQFALWTTVIVATPPAMFAFGQPFKYARLALFAPEVIQATVLRDRMFFTVYSMLAMALLAALTWEALFPDRTDQEIMGPLPVRPRTVAAARLAASVGMAVAFACALNVPTAIFFSFAATTHPVLGFLPTVLAAHVFSTVAACLFVFLVLLVARGTVAIALGSDAADSLATVLQLVAVIALIEVFFYLPTVLPILSARLMAGPDATTWMPPAWFVALYSWLVGPTPAGFGVQALRSLAWLAATAAVVIPLYLLSAPIMARRALESLSKQRPGPLARAVRSAGRLAPHPVTRAVAEFTITTLWRNRRHLVLVVSYAGVGIAIAAISVIAARLRAGLLSAELNTSLLAVPLVIMFFLSLGLRAAFRAPCELEANWPFRLRPPSTRQAAAGTELAMFVLSVVPVATLFAVTMVIAGRSWWDATRLLLYNLAAGWLLLEAVLHGWARVPFACAHVPDQEGLKSRWLLYLIPLNIFAFRGADAQLAGLGSARAGGVYLGVMIALALGLRAVRLARARREPIDFEGPPHTQIEVLNLSEAL